MMNTERIEVAGISVELVRKPIKNLHIGVYPPEGRVRVAAPPAVSDDAVRIAIITRLGWIKKKQRGFANQAREPARRYVSGETHYLWGKPLRLQVKTVGSRGCKISIESGDRIVMAIPSGADTSEKSRWLNDWYREALKDRAQPRIEKWCEKIGVPRPDWGVRIMRTKWGSCNPVKRLIWLNLELAKKPQAALDYVILHEIAHFVSRQHDDMFMNILDRNMPSWRQIRADLNAMPLPF